jgi:hypothetical protein
MQNSSGDLIDVTNEVGTSGYFMALARNGQLAAVSDAVLNRVKIAKELAEVEGKLNACNDPTSLAEFEKRYRKSKRTFEPRLQKLAADLEDRKCRLLAELRQIDQRLDPEELGGEWAVDPRPMTSLVPRLVRKGDTFVAERNEIIDRSASLPDFDVCKVLDQHFAREGEVSDTFPRSWERSHRVQTFTAAYLNPECRGKVHTLISKRRRLHSYPKA